MRRIFLLALFVFALSNPSFAQADSDSDRDGVFDSADLCENTAVPEESVPTVRLGVNRFALTDGDDLFDTTKPKGKRKGKGVELVKSRK